MDFIENIRDVHVGKMIQEKLMERSMKITEFAARINKDRSTVNNIFKRKSVDTELLIAISKALDYDFIHHVYFKEQPSLTIVISIQTEEELLKHLNLFEAWIRLAKRKKWR